jgi:hypothetical protein
LIVYRIYVGSAYDIEYDSGNRKGKISQDLRQKDMELLADLVEHCQHRLLRYLLYLTGRGDYAEGGPSAF